MQARVDAKTLTDKLARQVFEGIIAGEGTVEQVRSARGLSVVSDDGPLLAAIEHALAPQPDSPTRSGAATMPPPGRSSVR